MTETDYPFQREWYAGGTTYCPVNYRCKLYAKMNEKELEALDKVIADFTRAYDLIVDPESDESGRDIHFYLEDMNWGIKPPVLDIWVGGKNIQQIEQRYDPNETNMFSLVGDGNSIRRKIVSTTPLILHWWGRRADTTTFNFGRAKINIYPNFETKEEYEEYLAKQRR